MSILLRCCIYIPVLWIIRDCQALLDAKWSLMHASCSLQVR